MFFMALQLKLDGCKQYVLSSFSLTSIFFLRYNFWEFLWVKTVIDAQAVFVSEVPIFCPLEFP